MNEIIRGAKEVAAGKFGARKVWRCIALFTEAQGGFMSETYWRAPTPSTLRLLRRLDDKLLKKLLEICVLSTFFESKQVSTALIQLVIDTGKKDLPT